MQNKHGWIKVIGSLILTIYACLGSVELAYTGMEARTTTDPELGVTNPTYFVSSTNVTISDRQNASQMTYGKAPLSVRVKVKRENKINFRTENTNIILISHLSR